MVFSSSIFVFCFLPVLIFLYYLAKDKYSNIILLFFSLVFYAWGEPVYVLLMLLSIVVNYTLGFLIAKQWKYKKLFLWIAVAYNIGILFIFKYLNFSVGVINRFLGANIVISKIALPIGISFYTFQIMSYVIDLYRGKIELQKNLLHLALYVSLFPQLIAGPIVRYSDVQAQICGRYVDINTFYIGLKRFAIGFSKKILIADQLSPLVDSAFANYYPSIYGHWIGIIAYSLQIFFDFSGYSDMAIGLGKLFGFDFNENFDHPYISCSITEFWRRWHISLGSWFRDYLYIPLGGNRKGTYRTYINLLIVFLCTGFWHGASFNFIAWGLYYAVFLILEKAFADKTLNKLPSAVQHIYSVVVILFGWVLFRADNLTSAVQYIKHMFVASGADWANVLMDVNSKRLLIIAAGIFISIPHKKLAGRISRYQFVSDIFVIVVFLLALCYMVGSGFSPFLYFRF